MSNAPDVTEGSNKWVALLIAVLALFLAFSETMGKNAETESLAANVEASNLWAFFQAKTIRRTLVNTAAEEAEVALAGPAEPAVVEARKKQIAAWRDNADRYQNEVEEGTRDLMKKAKASEARRDLMGRKDDLFEYASACFQIAIVVASAAIITSMVGLVWLAIAFGAAGLGFMGFAVWAPLSFTLF